MPQLSFFRWLVVLGAALLLAGARPVAPPRATVYVFLAPDCPICQAATLTLRTLHQQYGPQGVEFVGLFPDPQTPAADIARFGREHQLRFPLRVDQHHALVRRYGARITPEVVVAGPDGRTLYQGRIDDAYVRLGRRRTVVQHHELADALAAVVSGKPVAVPKTEAVGCLIEP